MTRTEDTASGPPPALLSLLEARAPFEGLSLLVTWPWLLSMPRGDGRPVVLAPGYGAGDASMYPLFRYLQWLGYDVHHWGLGRNRGKVGQYVRKLAARLDELRADHDGSRVTLIGWSLGGVIVREIARDHPQLVREVITLGTPIIGGPKYTRVAALFARRENVDLDQLERLIHERNMRPITCPLTCIYSKTDGVVAWRASIDEYNPHARNLQVAGSHLGLAFNPLVWRIIARTLGGV
ncbi:MAG: esterase/lipase family protein [Lysobacterales bacterium]